MKRSLLMFLVVVLAFFAVSYHPDKSFQDRKDLEFFRKNVLKVQGNSPVFGSYTLYSFNGGKNWYAVEKDGGGFRIIGPANQELVKKIRAMNALLNYTKKDSSTEKDKFLVEAAGFTVK